MYLTVAWCLLIAAVAGGEPTGGGRVGLYDVGDQRQLLIDEAFFAQANRVRLRLHPAQKTGEKILGPQGPWESATLNWFSVLEDPGVIDRRAKYRMWYECYDVAGWNSGDDTSFCYSESRDGIHWNKPAVGLFDYQGSRKNNILFRQIGLGSGRSRVHGTGVFRDPTAPPEARYKAVSQGIWQDRTPPHRIAGMFSPDGLRWTRYAKPICDVFADSQYSGFWDPRLRKYVLYGRTEGGVGRAESSDFSHFGPLQLVLNTDRRDPPESSLYNPAALKYAGAVHLYLMFPSLYQHRPQTLDIRLATSRDGIHWTWPQQDAALVPLGPAGAADSKTLYLGQGLIQAGDEMWLYYSGSPLRHNEAELENLAKFREPRIFSRAVLRRDRFVSADAGREGGYFVTPPLLFAGAVLRLNLETRRGGSVRVGLVDASGQAVPGRGVADCLPMAGDQLDAVVRWKRGTDVSDRANRPTRMRVELIDASLYGFEFTGNREKK
jgi:hypothetical protein